MSSGQRDEIVVMEGEFVPDVLFCLHLSVAKQLLMQPEFALDDVHSGRARVAVVGAVAAWRVAKDERRNWGSSVAADKHAAMRLGHAGQLACAAGSRRSRRGGVARRGSGLGAATSRGGT